MIGTTTIEAACDLVTDGTHYTPRNFGKGIPFLTVKDVTDESLDFVGCSFMTEDDYETAKAGNSAPQRSDVLFSKDGTVGKVHVVETDQPFAVLSSLAILRPKKDAVDAKFLGYVLRSPRVIDDALKRRTGSAIRRVILSDLKNVRIPLPSLPEQRRIAAILDKADALRAKRRAALAQLDTLTQSIFLDMFGDPATNSKGWSEVALGAHTSKIGSGATPLGGEAAYKKDGIALIRSMNVRDGRFSRDGLAFIDDQQAARLDGVVVEPDDVLLNITGASVARVCRTPRDVLPARVNQHVAIIRPTSDFDLRFLEQCLLLPSMKRRLLRIAGAGATREAITKDAIERLTVIQPPRNEQDRFADMLIARQGLEVAQGRHLMAADALFSSLQHRAFRGEL